MRFNRFFAMKWLLPNAIICLALGAGVGWFLHQASWDNFCSIAVVVLTFMIALGTILLCLLFAVDAGRGQEATLSHLCDGVYEVCNPGDCIFVRNTEGEIGYIKAHVPGTVFEVKNGVAYMISTPEINQK